MLDWTRATVLTSTEMEVCWSALDLGETPWQFELRRVGPTMAERARVVALTFAGLQQRGLARDRTPGPVVTDHLRRLADPQRSCDIRYVGGGSRAAAVAACRGGQATLAVQHGEEVALLTLTAEQAVDELVALPGFTRRFAGREVQLSAAALDAASRAARPAEPGFAEALVAHGVGLSESALLASMCRDVRLVGQLGATVGTGDGRRQRRAPYVIAFHTTPSGQFRQVRRRDVVTVGPTGRDRLRAELDDLMELA
jgi:hypothetical protein